MLNIASPDCEINDIENNQVKKTQIFVGLLENETFSIKQLSHICNRKWALKTEISTISKNAHCWHKPETSRNTWRRGPTELIKSLWNLWPQKQGLAALFYPFLTYFDNGFKDFWTPKASLVGYNFKFWKKRKAKLKIYVVPFPPFYCSPKFKHQVSPAYILIWVWDKVQIFLLKF